MEGSSASEEICWIENSGISKEYNSAAKIITTQEPLL